MHQRKHNTLPYLIVILGSLGEFGFATFLLMTHGDAFPLYIATLYFVRERWSAARFLAHHIHRLARRRAAAAFVVGGRA